MTQEQCLEIIRKFPEGITTCGIARVLYEDPTREEIGNVYSSCRKLEKYKLVNWEVRKFGPGRMKAVWFPEPY